jgi:hypothetical protein
MSGWIKLHRGLLSKPLWIELKPVYKNVLITLLLRVNHTEAQWIWKGQGFRCQPGQLITSYEKLARASGRGITVQNVRTALKNLEKLEFLTVESTKTGILITITNWAVYQHESNYDNSHTDKPPTQKPQRTNKKVTTNKNDEKESKKDNKYKRHLLDFKKLKLRGCSDIIETKDYDYQPKGYCGIKPGYVSKKGESSLDASEWEPVAS